jgi:thiamine biosynthesis lipoprotein
MGWSRINQVRIWIPTNPEKPDHTNLIRLIFVLVLIFAELIPQQIHAQQLQEVKEIRYLMGTRASITLYHSDKHEGKRIIRKAFKIAEDLDRLLSNYKPASEISRINSDSEKTELEVSSALYTFLSKSQQLSFDTRGAFDVSIHGLMDLWRNARQLGKPPTREELDLARAQTGSNLFTLLPQNVVLFANPKVQFDSGGIGKGYAADEMLKFLRMQGIKHALINIGESSITAIGSPPGLPFWKVLFAFPNEDPVGVLHLNNRSLSASDSYSQKFTIHGKTYGHVIDPVTGMPTQKRVQAAAVASSATDAEALTKYLILRGNSALVGAERWKNVEVFTKDSGMVYMSDRFPLELSKE